VGLSTDQQPGTKIFMAEMTEHGFHASLVVELGTQAEVAAQFPKCYRMRPNTLTRDTIACRAIPAGLTIEEHINHPDYGNETVGTVSIDVSFGSAGVTGDVNETGIKRARSFLAKAQALGFEVKWMEPGYEHCRKSVRAGCGFWVVPDCYFTKAQAEQALGL
jgi:hypothetical protein